MYNRQPYQHHTRIPATGIYVYSFSLKPEESQPSGTVNMSRIDNATLQLTMSSAASMKLYTYVTNYNVLRVMSGFTLTRPVKVLCSNKNRIILRKNRYTPIIPYILRSLYKVLVNSPRICNIFKLRELPIELYLQLHVRNDIQDHG
jgi:hypothetical protein